jgi:hypothetical protein
MDSSMTEHDNISECNWKELSESVKTHGICNSYATAFMPTVTTSQMNSRAIEFGEMSTDERGVSTIKFKTSFTHNFTDMIDKEGFLKIDENKDKSNYFQTPFDRQPFSELVKSFDDTFIEQMKGKYSFDERVDHEHDYNHDDKIDDKIDDYDEVSMQKLFGEEYDDVSNNGAAEEQNEIVDNSGPNNKYIQWLPGPMVLQAPKIHYHDSMYANGTSTENPPENNFRLNLSLDNEHHVRFINIMNGINDKIMSGTFFNEP